MLQGIAIIERRKKYYLTCWKRKRGKKKSMKEEADLSWQENKKAK